MRGRGWTPCVESVGILPQAGGRLPPIRGLIPECRGLVNRWLAVSDSLDVRLYLAYLLVATLRFAGERSQHDLVQPDVDFHFLRRRLELSQWDFPGQHFVEHDTQRVDVGSMVDVVRAFHLLGSHVTGRAHHLLRAGQCEG